MTAEPSAEVRALLKDHFQREFMFLRPELDLDDALDLLDEGILDSLGILRVTAFVEEAFDVRLERDDLASKNFRNLAQIVALIMTARARIQDHPS
jgi:acyl carrier protein